MVRRLIQEWLTGFDAPIDAAPTLDAALLAAACRMLDVALSPAALALHRLIIAESANFPELAAALRDGGAAEGVTRIARLLHIHHPTAEAPHLAFLAQQFQTLVVAAPQSRAAGSGKALEPGERRAWCQASVHLFLNGLQPHR